MTVEYITPCVCCDHTPTGADSVHYGMPILQVAGNYIPHKQIWDVKCPNCGIGGLFEEKSAYLALRRWNDLMVKCYQIKGKEVPKPRWKEGKHDT